MGVAEYLVHDEAGFDGKKAKKVKKVKCFNFHLYTLVPHPVYTPTPQTWLINQLDAGANM